MTITTVTTEITAQGGILVAHDGSATADAALRTAAQLAPGFGHRVQVVRAWDISSAPRPPAQAAGYVPPLDDFEESALAALTSDTDFARAEYPTIAISCSVVHGGAAEKLIEVAPRLDLLVIGSRGLGGFVGLMLGSVTDQVVHHARCRVLVDKGTPLPIGDPARANGDAMERALISELGHDAAA